MYYYFANWLFGFAQVGLSSLAIALLGTLALTICLLIIVAIMVMERFYNKNYSDKEFQARYITFILGGLLLFIACQIYMIVDWFFLPAPIATIRADAIITIIGLILIFLSVDGNIFCKLLSVVAAFSGMFYFQLIAQIVLVLLLIEFAIAFGVFLFWFKLVYNFIMSVFFSED